MKLLILFSVLLIGCCPCREISIDYFQEDKKNLVDSLRNGRISECEYNRLLNETYEISMDRNN